MDNLEKIKSFVPKHKFFVGVDSDGCAFDTMGIKHTKAFIPAAIRVWELQMIERVYYEVAEFVNLYSRLRGINRFPGQLLTFEYLAERSAVVDFGVKLPDYCELKEFVNSGLPFSNASLVKFSEGKNSPFLTELMQWSKLGDEYFSEHAEGLQPFKYVKEALQKASKNSDTMVVSAASAAGLYNDWEKGGILQYMSLVAGQEIGAKKEQLQYAIAGKYMENHILMIGDAPGDYYAAKENGALFYPIVPGMERECWWRFFEEGYNRFMSEEYAGEYEEKLIKEFLKLLPEEKPWKI